MPPASVSLAAAHELLPALCLLFARGRGDGTAAESLRDELLAADRDSLAVFAARDDTGRVRGAVLVQALPGALGVAWPPRAETPQVEDALVAAACGWLVARGVKVCQAFPTAAELPDAAALERNGFRHVTQLVFMRREVNGDRDGTRSFDLHIPLSIDSYGPETAEDFVAVLHASNEGSLDCPELSGSRTNAELLQSYALDATGRLRKRVMASHDREPVGVLLTDAGTESGVIEVSYLGVIPSARGRGFGSWLVRVALFVAAQECAQAISLSVDARNEPALRLYRRHGFVEVERREVFLLQLPISDL